MTIRVIVQNRDELLDIEVVTRELDREHGRWNELSFGGPHIIKPGHEAEFHVYHLRDIRIQEAIPRPQLKANP